MSKSIQDKLFHAKRYLGYLRYARSRYSVHSPFVYKLIAEVIRPGSPEWICGPVEDLRSRLKRDRSKILKTDFGSGSEKEGRSQYSVTVRRLVKNSSLPSRRAARLFNLVRFMHAEQILELGTSLGISAGYLGKSNKDAKVTTLEGCPELARIAASNMGELKLNNVRVVQGDFDLTLSKILDEMDKLDLVFFDGNHRYGPTVDYFQKCLSLAHNNSVFVFDDIHSSREMEKAWQEIISNDRITVSIDLFHMGWVFFREELSREHFVLRYP